MDISSKGIRFTTQCALRRGAPIEITVDWPVLLNATCGMKLIISGCVVRSDSSFAVVRIVHYEFRTRASRQVPVLLDPLRCAKAR